MNKNPKVGDKFKFQQGKSPVEYVKIIEIFGNPENSLANPKQTIRITSKSYKDYTLFLSTLIKVDERLNIELQEVSVP